MIAVPKPRRIKSMALTDSAEGRECTLQISPECAYDRGVVFCHVRGVGDGIGTKPPDFWGYYGCGPCHAWEEAGQADPWSILIAIRRTQYAMACDGLLTVKGWKP